MKRTETPYSYDHANESITTVQGREFLVWDSFRSRATYAAPVDDPTNIAAIKRSGYIKNDLTVRKAIAVSFGLDSFHK